MLVIGVLLSILLVSNVYSTRIFSNGQVQYNQPWMWRGGNLNQQHYNQLWASRNENLRKQQYNQPSTWRGGNSNQQLQIKPGSNKVTTTTERVTKTSNPACDFVIPSKPDFRAPGRRISVAKCVEYIWERNNREDISTKVKNCQKTLPIGDFRTTVVGGRDALPGEFPHMGGVGWRAREGTWIFKCGCSLISSKFTLTAAHCSKSARDTSVQNAVPEIVRLGDKNIIDVFSNNLLPRDSKILRIIVHPNYSSPKKYFDIALMEIEEIKSFTSNVQPACLWGQFDTSSLGTSATLTGWGVIETATKKTSPKLQAATVDIINSEQCNALLRPSCNRLWCGVVDHQICGGKLSGGLDACQGDSGGPLQVKIPLRESSEGSIHIIIGVTSFGIGCALPDSPGVYTRVSSFIDWIESIVWRE
ncbi:unnamed protein product, partial [Brenthis ino]